MTAVRTITVHEREEAQRAVLLDALGAAHACTLGDVDLDLLAVQAVLDRLLVEGGLELRERLTHLHGGGNSLPL